MSATLEDERPVMLTPEQARRLRQLLETARDQEKSRPRPRPDAVAEALLWRQEQYFESPY